MLIAETDQIHHTAPSAGTDSQRSGVPVQIDWSRRDFSEQACYLNPTQVSMDFITTQPTLCLPKCKSLKKSYVLVGPNEYNPWYFDCACITTLPSERYSVYSYYCQAACPETPWLACGGSGVSSAFASGFQPTNPNPNPKTTTTRTIAFTSTIPIAKPSPSAPLQPTNIPAPPPIPQPQPEPQQPPPQPIPLPKPVPPQIKNPVSTLEEIQTLVPPTIPSSKEATTLDVKNLQQLATAVVSSTIKSQSSPTAFFTTVSSVSIPSSAISSVFAAGPQPVYTTTTELKPMSESNTSAGMVIGIVIGVLFLLLGVYCFYIRWTRHCRYIISVTEKRIHASHRRPL
ncbi:hypothetical protein BDR26DRAFT_594167 [Obelidium mucronatum]|nr:hypothetical protein BDR26DRAFT_594167 [Obelidium mucronatum]